MGEKRKVLTLSAAVAVALAAGAAGAGPAAADSVVTPVESGSPTRVQRPDWVHVGLVGDNPCGGQMIHDCKPR